ncbi:hypothetical protein [Streptomyces zaomyceticus]|uniref:hypothetical protein n=1 Tax=Streptomyces zaomyceticus TaxID=68286 RepID=UPI00342D4DA5
MRRHSKPGTGAATVGGGAAGLELGLLGDPVGALRGFTAGALLGNALAARHGASVARLSAGELDARGRGPEAAVGE